MFQMAVETGDRGLMHALVGGDGLRLLFVAFCTVGYRQFRPLGLDRCGDTYHDHRGENRHSQNLAQ